MPIRPKFKMLDIEKMIQQKVQIIEDEIIRRLQRLGEDCVAMSRESLKISASAFPVSYGSGPKSSLRQRRITQRDLNKNPNVSPPKFGDYLDQTKNLRNSIGYAIIKNGQVIKTSFGSEGSAVSGKIASERAKAVRNGYSLVVIAGQHYAAYVESRGYNVITSAEMWAKAEMPKLLRAIKKSIAK